MRDGHMDKKKSQKKRSKMSFWIEPRGGGERKREERERKKNFFSSLLSKIYGNRTVGFHRSKRQSQSTHRELHVSTKILEFRQTPRDREFSYLGYF